MQKRSLAEQLKYAKERMAAEVVLSRQSAASAPALELNPGWGPSEVISKPQDCDPARIGEMGADEGKALVSEHSAPKRALKSNTVSTKFSRLKNAQQEKAVDMPYDISIDPHASVAKKADYVMEIGTPYYHNLTLGEKPTEGLIRVFHGHIGTITSIATLTLGDKQYIFTASIDRTCRMYDCSNEQCVRMFEGHTGPVNSIAATMIFGTYSENRSTTLIEIPFDQKYFKLNDRKAEILEFEFDSTPKTMTMRVMCRDTVLGDSQLAKVQLDIDKDVVCGQSGQFIRNQWIQLEGLHFQKGSITTCFTKSEEKYFCSVLVEYRWIPGVPGSSNFTNFLRIICKEIKELPVRPSQIPIFISVTIADNSESLARLISGSADKTIVIWDTFTGVRNRVLRGHSSEVTRVALTDEYDKQYLFSSSLDQTLRMWSMKTGECLKSFNSISSVASISILKRELEGKRTVEPEMALQVPQIFIALKYEFDHSVGLHKIDVTVVKGQNIPKMNISDPGMESLVVVQAKEQKSMSAVSTQGSNPTWNFTVDFRLDDLSQPMLFKILRPSGFLGREHWIGHVFVDLSTLTRRRFDERWHDLNLNPCSVMYIAAGCGDRKARIFDVRTESQIAILEAHEGSVTAVQLCCIQEAEYLVTASMDGWAMLWNLKFLTKPKNTKKVVVSGASIQKRPVKKLGPLSQPISSIYAMELYGALRVFAGCHDSNTWMWTIDSRRIVDETTWQGRLQATLDSVKCCAFILLCILADVVSAIYFDFGVPNDQKDCFGRQSVIATGITCAVLFVFLMELFAQFLAQGKRYFYPVRFVNYVDMSIIAVSIGVAAFQAESDYTLPVYDSQGRYLSPADDVTPARYPDACAAASTSSSNAKTTQNTLTGIRALRIIARIAIAVRILRAVVKLHKMASLLGSGKTRKFQGHENLVTDIVVFAGTRALDHKDTKATPGASLKDYLVSGSADCTVNMYDVLGKTLGPRHAASRNESH